jgi:hypothetical protein
MAAKAPAKQRRVRCAGCSKLGERGEMVRIGAEWYHPDPCWAAKAASEAPPRESADEKAARVTEAKRRAGTLPPEGREGQPPLAGGSAADPPFLPAPSVAPNITVDLGDPETVLLERKDLPDEPVDGWPLKRGRVSASALGAFLLCPEQFRRSYILGEYRTTGGNAVTGTAAHTALTAVMMARIQVADLPRSGWQEWLDAKLEHDDQPGRVD